MDDYCEMLWQERSEIIVTLCNEYESGYVWEIFLTLIQNRENVLDIGKIQI